MGVGTSIINAPPLHTYSFSPRASSHLSPLCLLPFKVSPLRISPKPCQRRIRRQRALTHTTVPIITIQLEMLDRMKARGDPEEKEPISYELVSWDWLSGLAGTCVWLRVITTTKSTWNLNKITSAKLRSLIWRKSRLLRRNAKNCNECFG